MQLPVFDYSQLPKWRMVLAPNGLPLSFFFLLFIKERKQNKKLESRRIDDKTTGLL